MLRGELLRGTGARRTRPVDLPKSASDPCPINGAARGALSDPCPINEAPGGVARRAVAPGGPRCCSAPAVLLGARVVAPGGPRYCSARAVASGRAVLLGPRCCATARRRVGRRSTAGPGDARQRPRVSARRRDGASPCATGQPARATTVRCSRATHFSAARDGATSGRPRPAGVTGIAPGVPRARADIRSCSRRAKISDRQHDRITSPCDIRSCSRLEKHIVSYTLGRLAGRTDRYRVGQ